MEHFGKEIELDGYKFDSEKEAHFYQRFIKNCGRNYKVHPTYPLLDKFPVGGYNMRGISYTPDFIVYEEGEIAHVYDVKTSLDARAIDTAAKIRFKLFAHRYHMPVEVVVPRKNDFKMKVFNFGNTKVQAAHAKHDRKGNVKTYKNGHIMYDYYDVHKNVNYNLHDTIGF